MTFVLSRLRASRQGLIGPTVFPVYMLALKAVEIVMAFTRRALLLFACTTLVFAVIDFWQSRWLLRTDWDPRRLPPVVRLENRISRLNSLFELLFLSVSLLWLSLVPAFPWLLFGGASRILEPAPIWRVVYLPIVGLTAGGAILGAINFIRPFWTPARQRWR